ncbi:MAG: DUF4126 family protein [Mucilaginibacter sp.]
MKRKLTITHPFWQVVGIGALAGLRSASAPAIASHILSHHRSGRLNNTPIGFMQSDTTATVLKLLAAGEMAVDKMPFTPNRIKPASMAFRCLSGALAGAGISKATGGKIGAGAVFGATAALMSTYISFLLRKATVKATGVLDPIIGALEDALVLGAGAKLIRIDE